MPGYAESASRHELKSGIYQRVVIIRCYAQAIVRAHEAF